MPDHDLSDPTFRRRLARRLVSAARSRAARIGKACKLVPEDVERMLEGQELRCAVSGLRFSFDTVDAFVRHPFAPSLDRISSASGYDPSNVRLVCVAANFGLGQWGDEVLLAIARGVVAVADAVVAAETLTGRSDLRERLLAAEALKERMSGEDRRAQARRVAALKRAVTLGPEGLSRAARRAWRTRLSMLDAHL